MPTGPLHRFLAGVTLKQIFLLPALLGLLSDPAREQPVRPFPNGFQMDVDSPWQRRVEGKLVPRSPGVFAGLYAGWSNVILLQATNKVTDAIIVPDIGGRVLHYALDGESILFEPPDGAGKTLSKHGPGFPVGGSHCDVGPESARLPAHPHLWQGRHTWTSPAEWHVRTSSGRDPATGLDISKSIRLDPETGALHFTHWVDNKRPQDIAVCLRERTMCKAGGYIFFPVNKQSRFAAGWAMRRQKGEEVTWDGATPFSPKVRALDGVLVAKAEGEPLRLAADSDAGWIAYARGRLLFVKFFNWFADGTYADAGQSVEAGWDAQSAELEMRSPETKLRRNNPYGFAGRWVLLPLDQPVTTFDQARALAGRVTAVKNSSGKLDMAALAAERWGR